MKFIKLNITDIPVLYINLSFHEEKRNNIEKMLLKRGFKNVFRIEGVIEKNSTNQINPIIGCAKAKKNALNFSFSQFDENQPFIILEDDAKETLFFKETIEVPDDFDAVYLGISTFGSVLFNNGEYHGVKYIEVLKINENIFKLYNMLSAHAILYKKNNYSKSLFSLYDHAISKNIHSDIISANEMKKYNVYGLKYPIFYQSSSEKATNTSLTYQKLINL
jgi:hypothetical protein